MYLLGILFLENIDWLICPITGKKRTFAQPFGNRARIAITLPQKESEMSSSRVEKMIDFYGELVNLLCDHTGFLEVRARYLMSLFSDIKKDLSIEKLDMAFLRGVYHEYQDSNFPTPESITKIAENVFKDLAIHMRHPRVRFIFGQISSMAGADSEDTLFIFLKNVRLLEKDKQNGPAVVTLVVNKHQGLKKLLSQTQAKGIEVVHLVE